MVGLQSGEVGFLLLLLLDMSELVPIQLLWELIHLGQVLGDLKVMSKILQQVAPPSKQFVRILTLAILRFINFFTFWRIFKVFRKDKGSKTLK